MHMFSNDKLSKDKVAKILLEIDDKFARYQELVKFFGAQADTSIEESYKFLKEQVRRMLSS